MAAKMELKPAKPILKPYYTLEAAFNRLVSLGADLTDPSDLLLIAKHNKIDIQLLSDEPMVIVPLSHIIYSKKLNINEINHVKRKLNQICSSDNLGEDFFEEIVNSLDKTFVLYREFMCIDFSTSIMMLKPVIIDLESLDLADYDPAIYLNPESYYVNEQYFNGIILDDTPYLVVDEMFLIADALGLDLMSYREPIMFGMPATQEVYNSIKNARYVISDESLAEFEQFELGFNHGLDYEFKPQKKITPNIIAYNQQRQQNLTPDPDDVQAKYNELHAQNPKHSKDQLHQKLAKHFNTSVSTIKRRLKLTK